MGITDHAQRLLASRRSTLWTMILIECILAAEVFYPSGHAGHSWFLLTLPPSILAGGLASQLGSPKNWWAAYTGYIMDVNLKRFEAEYATRGEVLREEINQWVKTSNIKWHYQQNAFRHVFLFKKHAVLFKLAWG